jgi:methylmalonyl-CoA mutase C-terminal domain/subunit
MNPRKVRIMLARLGEGHKGALLNLAKALSDGGLEVVYTELQEPDAIVKSALQESVDHIGITTLPGADIHAFEEIIRLLKVEKAEHIGISAGGIIDEDAASKIRELDVMAFFPQGTTFAELIAWARENLKSKTG